MSVFGSAVSPFAHLLGRRAVATDAKKAKEMDDDDKKDTKKSEKDDDDNNDDDDDDDMKKKDTKKSESDDDKVDDDKKKDMKKSKSKKADSDQDDDDETDANSKAIRHRERARCAAIFADPAAAKRPDVAAQLAFGTPLNRESAINTLRAVAAGEPEPAPAQGAGLSNRMRAVRDADLGGNDGPIALVDPDDAVAAGIIAAGKARRGEKS